MISEIEHYLDNSVDLLWDYYDVIGEPNALRFYETYKRLDIVVDQLKANNYEAFTQLGETRELVRRDLLAQAKKLYFAIAKICNAN